MEERAAVVYTAAVMYMTAAVCAAAAVYTTEAAAACTAAVVHTAAVMHARARSGQKVQDKGDAVYTASPLSSTFCPLRALPYTTAAVCTTAAVHAAAASVDAVDTASPLS